VRPEAAKPAPRRAPAFPWHTFDRYLTIIDLRYGCNTKIHKEFHDLAGGRRKSRERRKLSSAEQKPGNRDLKKRSVRPAAGSLFIAMAREVTKSMPRPK
jgi:hypothetical protein